MSLSSAKAKLDAQGGDPVTGYISKTDHQESYDELVDDTALTGATTAEALDVTGALTAGTIASDATVAGTGLAGGLLSAATPVINGVAAPGTSAIPSRQDHVHPSDTTKVTGPASATDNALVRFDGTGGKTVQNSGITVDDSGYVTSNLLMYKASANLTVGATSGNAASLLSADAGTTIRYFDRPATYVGGFYFRTGTSLRWRVVCDGTPEGGSDAGSDFAIRRYTDAAASAGDALTIYRATGKTTLGSVGASAGLELGSSGPRVMSGTGSPEGVVTAPVGSMWTDTAATTGAIRWIKASGTGNTGWVVEYGDTGWRTLTAESLASGWAWGAFARVRRVGNTVELGLALNGASASGSYPYTLPSGFGPKGDTFFALYSTVANFAGTPYGKVYSDGSIQVVSYSTATYALQATYTTANAWPTSLPGSAA